MYAHIYISQNIYKSKKHKNSLLHKYVPSITYRNKLHINSKCILHASNASYLFLVCNNNNSWPSFQSNARLAIDQVQSRDSSGGVFRFEGQSATSTSRFSSGVSCCSSRIIFRFFAGCPSSSSSSSLEGNFSSSAVRLTGVSAPTECPPTAVFKNVRP